MGLPQAVASTWLSLVTPSKSSIQSKQPAL